MNQSIVCEKCGHEMLGGNLIVREIPDWGNSLSTNQRALMATKFNKVEGALDDGTPYRTVFLTTTGVHSIVPTDDDAGIETALYNDVVIPALLQLGSVADIIGCLVHPSVIPLAVTDLRIPFAVFTFVTVKSTPDLRAKLACVGLAETFDGEGLVDTLQGFKWADYSSGKV